jgi:hypothetical protein
MAFLDLEHARLCRLGHHLDARLDDGELWRKEMDMHTTTKEVAHRMRRGRNTLVNHDDV